MENMHADEDLSEEDENTAHGDVAHDDPIERHIRKRIRLLRKTRNLSRQKLDLMLGMAPGTVAGFEYGTRRLGSPHIFALAEALTVPESFFYDDLPEAAVQAKVMAYDEKGAPYAAAVAENRGLDPEAKREVWDFVRTYYRLPEEVRHRMFFLIKTMVPDEGKR